MKLTWPSPCQSHQIIFYLFREVREDSVGAKLIFSSMGDKDYDGQGCWAYTGKVGSVGGENGQTVNLGRDCINMGIIIHEVMHSMGK